MFDFKKPNSPVANRFNSLTDDERSIIVEALHHMHSDISTATEFGTRVPLTEQDEKDMQCLMVQSALIESTLKKLGK